MRFLERWIDRMTLFTKYWKIACEMNMGSMTGGYYDDYVLNRISIAIDEYEQAKIAYMRKWSKTIG